MNSEVFLSRNELRDAIEGILDDRSRDMIIQTYGEVNVWDVSQITDMSELFKDIVGFNYDTDRWDVSLVTNMSSMFSESLFNQPIGGWNVRLVTNMSGMFSENNNFEQDLSNWVIRQPVRALSFHQQFNVDYLPEYIP